MNNITRELRAEIEECKKRRHEFVLRKLAFSTALLGVGSLTIQANKYLPTHSSPLLYLVPLIAVAFDLYILVENFRLNRAGEFLRTHEKYALYGEKEWECFVIANPNRFVSFANLVVTFILLTGASFLLWRTGPNISLFVTWIVAVVISETIITLVENRRSFKGVK